MTPRLVKKKLSVSWLHVSFSAPYAINLMTDKFFPSLFIKVLNPFHQLASKKTTQQKCYIKGNEYSMNSEAVSACDSVIITENKMLHNLWFKKRIIDHIEDSLLIKDENTYNRIQDTACVCVRDTVLFTVPFLPKELRLRRAPFMKYES